MRLPHTLVGVLLSLLAAGCAARSSAVPPSGIEVRTDSGAPITATTPLRCIDDPAAALRAARSCGVAPGDSIGVLRALIVDARFLRADPFAWTTTGATISQRAGERDWIFIAEVFPDSSAVDHGGAMAAEFGDSTAVPTPFARRRIATGRARIDHLAWARRYRSRPTWSAVVRALGAEALDVGSMLACSTGRNARGDDLWSLQIGRTDQLIVVTATVRPPVGVEPAPFLLETVRAPRDRFVPPGSDSQWTEHTDVRSCRDALDRLLDGDSGA